ncbi:MAG: hypothetical protein IJU43_10385 [Lachnospiraceae bacterium]|nr:hypothetical protein [Lachnospiraceae bacterium]
MKLTGELKKHVEETDSREEKKRLIEEAGMELTDEEMDIVSGGITDPRLNSKNHNYGNFFQ